MFLNCAPYNNCISETNEAQVDNADDPVFEMPMNILLDNYYNIPENLWQYSSDEPSNALT